MSADPKDVLGRSAVIIDRLNGDYNDLNDPERTLIRTLLAELPLTRMRCVGPASASARYWPGWKPCSSTGRRT
jgi:hypothetical protein